MGKTVAHLKRKHRNSIWLDRHRKIWFWDTHRSDWNYLAPGVHPRIEPGFHAARDYYNLLLGRLPETHGPYTEITKAEYQ